MNIHILTEASEVVTQHLILMVFVIKEKERNEEIHPATQQLPQCNLNVQGLTPPKMAEEHHVVQLLNFICELVELHARFIEHDNLVLSVI